MPLEGEYAPSADEEMANQVREIKSSPRTHGLLIEGTPVVVITSLGARSRAAQEPRDPCGA